MLRPDLLLTIADRLCEVPAGTQVMSVPQAREALPLPFFERQPRCIVVMKPAVRRAIGPLCWAAWATR